MDSVHRSLFFRYLALMIETVDRDYLAADRATRHTTIGQYVCSGRDPMDKEFTIAELRVADHRLRKLVAKGRLWSAFVPTLTQEELEDWAGASGWDYEALERAHRQRLTAAAKQARAVGGAAIAVNAEDLSTFEQVKLLLWARERRKMAEAADLLGPWSKDA